MSPLAWIYLLSLAGLWSGAFLATELILDATGPWTAVALRIGFGAATLLVIVLLTRHRMPTSIGTWGAFAVMGILNNLIPFAFITGGQIWITSGLAAILNATTPIFIVLLAHVATVDEKLNWAKGIGVALGFAGVVVLIGPSFSTDGPDQMQSDPLWETIGRVMILAAACSHAFAALWGRRLRQMPALSAATGQLTCSALASIGIAWFIEVPDLSAIPLSTWGVALLQGAAATALAYILYFRILALAGATNLLLVTFLMPPGAVLWGATLLGEPVEPMALAGMGLILAGLVVIDGRIWRAVRRPDDRSPLSS